MGFFVIFSLTSIFFSDFVLKYARKGELLYYLNKLSSFDLPCSRFYAAEIVVALEYLQSHGIIHRCCIILLIYKLIFFIYTLILLMYISDSLSNISNSNIDFSETHYFINIINLHIDISD